MFREFFHSSSMWCQTQLRVCVFDSAKCGWRLSGPTQFYSHKTIVLSSFKTFFSWAKLITNYPWSTLRRRILAFQKLQILTFLAVNPIAHHMNFVSRFIIKIYDSFSQIHNVLMLLSRKAYLRYSMSTVLLFCKTLKTSEAYFYLWNWTQSIAFVKFFTHPRGFFILTFKSWQVLFTQTFCERWVIAKSLKYLWVNASESKEKICLHFAHSYFWPLLTFAIRLCSTVYSHLLHL